jgi:hypothetical protein
MGGECLRRPTPSEIRQCPDEFLVFRSAVCHDILEFLVRVLDTENTRVLFGSKPPAITSVPIRAPKSAAVAVTLVPLWLSPKSSVDLGSSVQWTWGFESPLSHFGTTPPNAHKLRTSRGLGVLWPPGGLGNRTRHAADWCEL